VTALGKKIEQEIRECGPIPFSRYMELCLYDQELGYYSRNAAQFGKSGDFYTSSDVAVFGRLMARQFDEMWRVMDCPENLIVQELGPGRGLFVEDVLDYSHKKFPELFRALRYILVERSPALRRRIEATLGRYLDRGKAELDFSAVHNGLGAPAAQRQKNSSQGAGPGESRRPTEAPRRERPSPNVPTIVFANELFDALPVEIVSAKGSLRIDIQGGHLVETWVPTSREELEFLDRYSVHPDQGERIEVPLQSLTAMRATCDFGRGFVVIIDYGYTREEQLAGRHRGTLKAIRQHSVSANPYEAPGEQDITADVNFTALTAVAEKQGFRSQKLISQSQFLMGIGESNQFADAFEDCRLPEEHVKVALQLKHLVTPAGMGESFYVQVASKGIDREKVAGLAGLGFGRQ
jgi:SAM-dependent MidA family methyltransferase